MHNSEKRFFATEFTIWRARFELRIGLLYLESLFVSTGAFILFSIYFLLKSAIRSLFADFTASEISDSGLWEFSYDRSNVPISDIDKVDSHIFVILI